MNTKCEVSKEMAMEIIKERISGVMSATNLDELKNRENYACGAANALWSLGVFTQKEHGENFDKITEAVKTRKAEYLGGGR